MLSCRECWVETVKRPSCTWKGQTALMRILPEVQVARSAKCHINRRRVTANTPALYNCMPTSKATLASRLLYVVSGIRPLNVDSRIFNALWSIKKRFNDIKIGRKEILHSMRVCSSKLQRHAHLKEHLPL